MPATTETAAAVVARAVPAIEAERHYTPRTDKRPSGKQIYCAAHLMAELLGLDWPQSSADASAMIERLREARGAQVATAEVPF